jgi:hypothetical protein
VGWRLYVPWDERRTRRVMDHLAPKDFTDHAVR